MANFLTFDDLQQKTLKEIYELAKNLKIPYYSQMNKKELSLAVIRVQEEKQGYFQVSGVLDKIYNQDFGFLRPINYAHSNEDIYISASQMTRFGLRNGDKITGTARPPKSGERYYGLMNVRQVNGKDPEEARERPHFPALTPLYPEKRIQLESSAKDLSDNEVDSIKEELTKNFSSKIKLNYKHDTSLIGGLIVQVGSTMVDTSIKNKLKQIENRMIEA